MLRIGVFARLGDVSVKTLHHYDALNVLKPAHMDPQTGYRYYRADQLGVLHRIRTLQQLGFSLHETAEILNRLPDTARFRSALHRKRDESLQAIQRERMRIAQIDRWLTRKESDMPRYDVMTKQLPSQKVASIRVLRYEGEALEDRFRQIETYLAGSGTAVAGPGMILYHQTPDGVDAEVAYPITGDAAGNPPIAVYDLDPVPLAACLVYTGTHAGMGEASQTIARWIEQNGYRVCGPNRVLFLDCGHAQMQPGVATVETQYPITPM